MSITELVTKKRGRPRKADAKTIEPVKQEPVVPDSGSDDAFEPEPELESPASVEEVSDEEAEYFSEPEPPVKKAKKAKKPMKSKKVSVSKPKPSSKNSVKKLARTGLQDLSNDPYENEQLNTVNDFVRNNQPLVPNSVFSLRDRINLFQGNTTDLVLDLARFKDDWRYHVYTLDDKLSAEYRIWHPAFPAIPDCEISQCDSFPLDGDCNVKFNNDPEFVLKSEERIKIPANSRDRRLGLILNCGGIPLSVKWFKSSMSNAPFQFLAISVVPRNTSSEKLAMASAVQFESFIQIYRMDLATTEISLFKTLRIPFGAITSMEWLPCDSVCGPGEEQGVLCAVCSDGALRLMKMVFSHEENSHNKSFVVEKPSLTLRIPDTKITCFDFVSQTKILAGTLNGCIAQFDVTETSPLCFVHKLNINIVSSVSTSFPDALYSNGELSQQVVFVASAESVNLVLDLKDLRNLNTESARSKGAIYQCAYVPMTRSFVYADNSLQAKLATKKFSQSIMNMVKHDSLISSFGVSSLHPLIISGSSDGAIKLSNVARRALASKHSSEMSAVHLWNIQYSQMHKCFRILTPLKQDLSQQSKDATFVPLAPIEVNVNNINWNTNQAAFPWYAASVSGGLIFIERVRTATVLL